MGIFSASSLMFWSYCIQVAAWLPGVSIKFDKCVEKSSDNKIYEMVTVMTYLVTYP